MKIVYLFLITGAVLLGACSNSTKKLCIAKENTNCICTMDYNPVCGCDGVTYSNKCAAICVGINDYTEGECD